MHNFLKLHHNYDAYMGVHKNEKVGYIFDYV